MEAREFALGIDTCGPAGSVALGRLLPAGVEMLGERLLEGRQYAAQLTGAVEKLLAEAGAELAKLGGIVVVNGPGSFTGVRVGVSSAQGLAVGLNLPVAAVSRLAVLATKAGAPTAALDAHRNEVYLRTGPDAEQLAGRAELAALEPVPTRLAICEEAAEQLVTLAWPAVELARVAPPLASDALRLGAELLLQGKILDPALLDGHYLRRSDAEIFGEQARP